MINIYKTTLSNFPSFFQKYEGEIFDLEDGPISTRWEILDIRWNKMNDSLFGLKLKVYKEEDLVVTVISAFRSIHNNDFYFICVDSQGKCLTVDMDDVVEVDLDSLKQQIEKKIRYKMY